MRLLKRSLAMNADGRTKRDTSSARASAVAAAEGERCIDGICAAPHCVGETYRNDATAVAAEAKARAEVVVVTAKKSSGESRTVQLARLTEENLADFVNLNSNSLPVAYADNFYRQFCSDGGITAFLAYSDGVSVGAISCKMVELGWADCKAVNCVDGSGSARTEDSSSAAVTKSQLTQDVSVPCRCLYIITLAVSENYRRQGIASALLDHLLNIGDGKSQAAHLVRLHVHVDNASAMSFYRAHGFHVLRRVNNYYCKMNPPDSYLLQKRLQPQVAPADRTASRQGARPI